MTGEAKRDGNSVTTLIAVSSADGITPVVLWADPTTHRLLVDLPSGAGTVTTVSVVTANGFAGSVANATTTPAITLSTTVTGVLKGNGTAISAAVAGTDYTTPTGTETLSNKTIDNSNTITVKDTLFTIQDDGDATKLIAFQASGISTGTTRTITMPNSNTTLPIISQVVTISGPTAARTYTFPDANTTVVGTTTSQALTNKTYEGLTITASSGTLTIANSKTLTASVSMTLQGGDASVLSIAAGKTLTASNTITLAGTDSTTMTFPTTNATIARTDAGQTFTGTQIMTSPKILTSILDTNGNEEITFVTTASAVNEIEITNAATGTTGPMLKPSGETNIDLRLSGKGTGAVHIITGSYGDLTADSDGATITFNLATSNIHTVTLGGNRTLALSNEHVGQCFMLRLLQDGTGSRTVTWFTTIKWAGGVAPTLTTTASKADMIGFLVTSAGNYDGFVVGQNL